MKIVELRVACVVASIAVVAIPTQAAARAPSVFLRCDGKPAHMSDGERAARVLAITAVIGLLIPGPEQENDTERLSGVAGAAACSTALSTEGDPIRRIELTLARAIHDIEANDSNNALADSQTALELSQSYSNDTYFARSLGLSVWEVRSAALLSAKRYSDAEAAAYKMADAAPWDVINQLNAWPLAGLTDNRNQQFEDFLRRLAKLWNGAEKYYAMRLEWNGKFREAAGSYAAIMDVTRGAGFVNPSTDPSAYWKAKEANAFMMAGDRARAEQRFREATALNETLASQHAMNAGQTIAMTDELLGFYKILSLTSDGKLAEARAAFLQRPRWNAASVASVSWATDRLRQGVPASELLGPLAKSGAQIRQAILDDDQLSERDGKKLGRRLFSHMRPLMRASEFGGSKALWRVDRSRYLVAKKGELADAPYEVINTFDIYGIPSSYAVLMHAALLAQSRGKQGFVVVGERKATDTIAVLFGNRGEPGTPDELLIDASSVIRDLQSDFPQPAP
jgi:tetratricopeptide (TPR) repeat protein